MRLSFSAGLLIREVKPRCKSDVFLTFILSLGHSLIEYTVLILMRDSDLWAFFIDNAENGKFKLD